MPLLLRLPDANERASLKRLRNSAAGVLTPVTEFLHRVRTVFSSIPASIVFGGILAISIGVAWFDYTLQNRKRSENRHRGRSGLPSRRELERSGAGHPPPPEAEALKPHGDAESAAVSTPETSPAASSTTEPAPASVEEPTPVVAAAPRREVRRLCMQQKA